MRVGLAGGWTTTSAAGPNRMSTCRTPDCTADAIEAYSHRFCKTCSDRLAQVRVSLGVETCAPHGSLSPRIGTKGRSSAQHDVLPSPGRNRLRAMTLRREWT